MKDNDPDEPRNDFLIDNFQSYRRKLLTRP